MNLKIEYDDVQPGISADEQKTGFKRVAQIALGVILVAAGIAMLILPGPGAVALIVGLNLIKPDNFLVQWMRRKVPGIPEDGAIPTKYLVLGGVFLVASTALSIVYGDDVLRWVKEFL